jgi:O-antigen/teichoic acid export membrane protein
MLTLAGLHTVSILVDTGVFLLCGAWLQLRQARRLLQASRLWPAFEPEATRSLLKFGAFVWLQSLGGVIFSQFDRILLGITLGAQAVAPYSLCVQFSQPIAGLTGSGLNFLFPYLSGRAGSMSNHELRRTLLKAFTCNFAAVAVCACGLLLAGDRLMRLWAGAAVAQSAAKILPLIVVGSALLGLSVTGIYALQALGMFRTVAFISLGSRVAMLPLMIYLLHTMGLQGLAISRACFGAVALLVYLPLGRAVGASANAARPAPPAGAPLAFQEGSKL